MYISLAALVLTVAFVIWSTGRKKLNPFFALALAALGVGLLTGMPLPDIVTQLKTGFGDTMGKVGVLIILGTTLGGILEKTGATVRMAEYLIQRVSKKNAPLGIALTGYIIGFPVFCDSGFIVLNGLNHSIVRKTSWTMAILATSLGTSLYAVHCLVPPHPGITAAIETIGADFGTIMLMGALLSIPAAAVGLFYARWKGKRVEDDYTPLTEAPQEPPQLPPAGLSFLPILLPISLIACGSFAQLFAVELQHSDQLVQWLLFLGDPSIALGAGILVALFLVKRKDRKKLPGWLTQGVEKAGVIVAIIGAGGMYGQLLQHSGIGRDIGTLLGGTSLGIFLPFLITAFLKSAQGSSTVAVITGASLVAPMLGSLGLDHPLGLSLTILSLGAGSMCVSHMNDSYFWVVSRFSGISAATTLKVFTTATLLMGLVTQLLIWAIWISA